LTKVVIELTDFQYQLLEAMAVAEDSYKSCEEYAKAAVLSSIEGDLENLTGQRLAEDEVK